MSRIHLTGPCPGPRRGLYGLLATLALGLAAGAVSSGTLSAAPGVDVIDAQRGHIRQLEADVQRIDGRAADAADAHARAQRRVDGLRARIARTSTAITRAEADHAIAVKRLSQRLVALYRAEPPTLFEVLVSSGGLGEALDTEQSLEAIGSADKRIVESLSASRARLTALRAEMVSSRRDAEANARTASRRLAELRGLLSSRNAVLARAQATLDGMIAARTRAQRAAAIRRQRAAVAAANRRAEAALLRRARTVASAPAPTPVAAAAAAASPAVAAGPAPGGDMSARLQRIAQCESGGNPRAVSASGQYRGKYQFDRGTWASVGGSGDPAAAPEAEQDRRAAMLYARSGAAPWPICGLR